MPPFEFGSQQVLEEAIWRLLAAAALSRTRLKPSEPDPNPNLALNPNRNRGKSLGWTFFSGCSTSCVQRSIDVCSTEHHSTRRTAASTPQTLLVGSIYGGSVYSRVVSVLDSSAVGPGFISKPRHCRVTVLGKLFTPIVPVFTKQQNW